MLFVKGSIYVMNIEKMLIKGFYQYVYNNE